MQKIFKIQIIFSYEMAVLSYVMAYVPMHFLCTLCYRTLPVKYGRVPYNQTH